MRLGKLLCYVHITSIVSCQLLEFRKSSWISIIIPRLYLLWFNSFLLFLYLKHFGVARLSCVHLLHRCEFLLRRCRLLREGELSSTPSGHFAWSFDKWESEVMVRLGLSFRWLYWVSLRIWCLNLQVPEFLLVSCLAHAILLCYLCKLLSFHKLLQLLLCGLFHLVVVLSLAYSSKSQLGLFAALLFVIFFWNRVVNNTDTVIPLVLEIVLVRYETQND